MPPLPVVSASEAVRAFEVFGWRAARGGNHIVLIKEGHSATLSIPKASVYNTPIASKPPVTESAGGF